MALFGGTVARERFGFGQTFEALHSPSGELMAGDGGLCLRPGPVQAEPAANRGRAGGPMPFG